MKWSIFWSGTAIISQPLFVFGYQAYSMQEEDLTQQNENENKTGPSTGPWGTPAGSGWKKNRQKHVGQPDLPTQSHSLLTGLHQCPCNAEIV